MSQIRIDHLADHLEDLSKVVSWVHSEWGHLMPETTYPELVSIFQKQITPHQIPETIVAIKDDKIVGTASLVKHDLTTRMELTPWLAAVYVQPEHRGMGIGSSLVKAAIAEAKYLGLEKFYLITPDRTSFYARLGWKALEETYYRGENVTIMVYQVYNSANHEND